MKKLYFFLTLLFLASFSYSQTTLAHFGLNNNLDPDNVNAFGTPTATVNGLSYSTTNCEGSHSLSTNQDATYLEIAVSTMGFQSISVSFQNQKSNNGAGNDFWELLADYDNNGSFDQQLAANAASGSCSTNSFALDSNFDDRSQIKLRLNYSRDKNITIFLDDIEITGTPIVTATPVLSPGSVPSFGNVCLNTEAGPNSFTITGENLTADDVTISALSGFSFSTTAGGTYTAALTLPQTGGSYSQEVYVKFNPNTASSYNGSVLIGGGGASSVNVPLSGSGVTIPLAVANPNPNGASDVCYDGGGILTNISWENIASANSYDVYFGTSGSPAFIGNTSSNFYPVGALLANTTYYWSVVPKNDCGEATGNITSSFTTASSPCSSDYCDVNITEVRSITRVLFSNIDNSSSPSTGSASYEDYTAIEGNVVPGDSYVFTTEGFTNGNNTFNYSVFIDWNQNGDFSDIGEGYYAGTITNSTGIDGQQTSTNIIAPTNALPGITGMRVISSLNPLPSDPCGTTISEGQIEDYTLRISDCSFISALNGYTATSGFQAWSFNHTSGSSNSGNFLGDAALNGDGDNTADGDINTGSQSWGLYANSGQIANQNIELSNLLGPNSTLSLQMDNGWIENGGTVGLGLKNGAGEDLIEFYFRGGESDYKINALDNETGTGISFTDEGLQIDFTLSTQTTVDIIITELSNGTTHNFSKSLKNPIGGQLIREIRLFNAFAGSGSNYDAFFNSLQYCAEPVTDNDGDGYTADVDCDDNNAAIYPGAEEICDGIDNNCDGLIDDADPAVTGQDTWYADVDGDGYGNPNDSILACNLPSGYVSDSTDCDDTNAAINPGNTEINFNGIDDDCNPDTLDVNSGIFESYVVVNNNYYDLLADTGNPDFNGFNLSSFTCGDNLTLNGAQNKIFKCDTGDILNGKLFYRVYESSSTPGSFVELNLNWSSNDSGAPAGCQNQTWETVSYSVDLLNNLTPGNYILEIYTSADYTSNPNSGTHYANNGGANYAASFSYYDDAPQAICQDITVQLDANGQASIVAADIDGGSNDACGIASLSASQTSFDCSHIGSNVVTLTVTDNNGNVSSCTANVTVEDNIAPQAICQDITVQLDANGQASIVAADIDGGSNDACGIASLSAGQTSFDCSHIGSNAVTLTVTDNNGNVSSCTANVTVEDNIAPQAICQDITVQLDANGQASIVAADIDGGSNDACGIASLSASQTSFDCSNIGSNVVTLTVTDNNGNVSSCIANVTVEDTVAPTAVCQDITVQLDAGGVWSTGWGDIDNGSFDACGIASYQINGQDFVEWTCNDVGANTVVLTVTDNNGNVSTCTATVTVEDTVAPNALCQDITVQLDANGQASIVAADIDGGSNDACGIASLSASQTSFDCSNIGSNVVTLTVTDNNGNVSSCTANVTVEDNIAPQAICQDITVQLDANGQASIVAADIDGGSNDACGIALLSASQTSFDCSHIGSNVVTLTVTDNNGNVSSCTANVTVKDNIAPQAICQDITVQLDANGQASIVAADIDGGSNDACGIASLSAGQTSFDCSHIGSNAVTLTVTDNNGNVSSCTANVTVEDNIAPQAICQDITVQLDANGQASIVATDIDGGSNDACGIASLSASQTSFDCSNIGSNAVTLTVTDNNGNVSSCTANVTVEDNIAPQAICQDITVQLDANGQASIVAADIDGGSNDACGIVSISIDKDTFDCSDVPVSTLSSDLFFSEYIEGSSFNKYIEIYNGTGSAVNLSDYEIRLFSNGSNSATTTNITTLSGILNHGETVVYRNSSATIYNGASTVGAAINWNGDDAVALWKVSSDTAIDIIGQIGTDPGSAWNAGGNTTANATLVRNSNIINGNISNAAGFPSLATEWTMYPIDTVSNLGSHTISSGSATEVTLTVTDNNGNVSTCTATVTVEDTVAPNALCQDITVQLDANGQASITAADIDGGSNDACGIASLSAGQTSFDCSHIGSNTVTLTVTDNNGNVSSCTANVTVEDNIAPQAICQDITVQLDANGQASIVAADIDGGSNDACGIASLSAGQTSFDCSHIGSNTVTLTVTDNNGNVSSCTANVTVEDNIAPQAICQDITVQLDANGQASIVAADIDGGSNDACGIASLSAGQTSFDCSHIGSNSVTLTVTDNNGNVSSCTANVTVEDNIAPQAICQDITVQLDANGQASIVAADIDGGSNDACGIASLSAGQTSFDCSHIGSNSVTLTVTDNNGNVSSCTANVTVEDNIAPIVDCFNLTVTLDSNGNGTIDVASFIANNNSTDNCEIESIVLSETSFDCSDIGGDMDELIISEYVDGSGNNDWIEIFNGTGNTIVLGEVLNGSFVSYYAIEIYSNGSSTPTTVGLLGSIGDREVYKIAHTDAPNISGVNSNFGSPAVVFDGNDAIALTHDGIAVDIVGVIGNNPGSGWTSGTNSTYGTTLVRNIDVQQGNVTNFIGALANEWTQYSQNTVSFLGDHEIEITNAANNVILTVTDTSGNVSTCEGEVTVIDTTSPVAQCQNVTVQLNEFGVGSTTAQAVDNGSNDACGIESLVLSQTSFDCSNIGDNTVTLTVTDNNGNTSTCEATVTVEDNVAPNAICVDTTVILDANGNGSIVAADIDGGSNDACGIASLSASKTSFDCSNVGDNTVTLTVIDNNGNSSTCTATVTVIDSIAPNAVCNSISVMLDSTGNYVLDSNDVDAIGLGSNDACGIASMSVSPNTFTCDEIGDNTVTLTVTDENGNISTCTTTVTVNGIVPEVSISEGPLPEFCQGAVLVLTASTTQPDSDIRSYQWSGSGITGPTDGSSVNVSGNGTYTVTVTSETNCVTTETYTVTGFDAGSLISSYTILAVNEVFLHGSNLVQSGAVGAMSNTGLIKLHQASTIVDFGQAANFSLNQGSTVGTQINQPANPVIPSFVFNTQSNNTSPNVTINANQSQTLTGSVYGTINVKQNATVTFTQSNVYIDQLNTLDGASIEFSGCANVYINDKFTLAKNGTINSNGNNVVMYVNEDVQIERGSYVRARIHSNGNELLAKGANANGNNNPEPTYMIGMFIANKVHGSINVIWNADDVCNPCPSASPNAPIAGNNGGQYRLNFDVVSWPNPSNTVFNLKLKTLDLYSEATVFVYDTSNKLVHKGSFNPDQEYSFGDALEGGVYIVKINQGANTKTVRLVKY